MSVRGIRGLERGQVGRPRWASVSLLADALGLSEAERAVFRAAAAGLRGGADGPARVPVALSQLPPDIEDFTGRQGQVEVLRGQLACHRREPGGVVAGVVGRGEGGGAEIGAVVA